MIKLQANYPQYFDTDGSPLEGGSIYFGTAGLNPETSPITVFKDQAGTLAVAQPLRTVNGSIVHGGSPIHVFAEATDYSYTVRNKRGELVSTTLHFLQDIGASVSQGYAESASASAASALSDAAGAAASAIAAEASADAAAAVFSGETLIDNGELLNAIRRAGTIPPASYTSGQFVIDRWKAGTSGMTRDNTTSDIAGEIRIISGTIKQTVYAPSGFSAFASGEQVTVAWDGQSQLSFNGGSYVSSPYIHTFSSSASSFTIEFNNAGTGVSSGVVSKVRAYRGNRDKGITNRSATDYEIFLSRYYQELILDSQSVYAAGQANRVSIPIIRMVSVPTVTFSTISAVNVASFSAVADGRTTIATQIIATAAAPTRMYCTIKCDTGL